MSDLFQIHVAFRDHAPGLRDGLAKLCRAEHRTQASLIRSIIADGVRQRLNRLPAPDSL